MTLIRPHVGYSLQCLYSAHICTTSGVPAQHTAPVLLTLESPIMLIGQCISTACSCMNIGFSIEEWCHYCTLRPAAQHASQHAQKVLYAPEMAALHHILCSTNLKGMPFKGRVLSLVLGKVQVGTMLPTVHKETPARAHTALCQGSHTSSKTSDTILKSSVEHP